METNMIRKDDLTALVGTRFDNGKTFAQTIGLDRNKYEYFLKKGSAMETIDRKRYEENLRLGEAALRYSPGRSYPQMRDEAYEEAINGANISYKFICSAIDKNGTSEKCYVQATTEESCGYRINFRIFKPSFLTVTKVWSDNDLDRW